MKNSHAVTLEHSKEQHERTGLERVTSVCGVEVCCGFDRALTRVLQGARLRRPHRQAEREAARC